MSNVTVRGGSLEGIIEDALKNVESVADQAAITCSEKAAKRAQTRLKSTSPGRKYARGWKVKKDRDGATVYNASQPSLTHLLENGHDVISHGVKVGRARAIPHIKPVEEETKVYFEELIVSEIQRRLNQS